MFSNKLIRIIAKVKKKGDFEKEKNNLLNEKNLLSAQFADLEAKFKALIDSLENQYKDFLNEKNNEKNTINSDFVNFDKNTFANFNKQISDIREEHKKEIEGLRTNWEDKKRIVNDLKIKKESIKHIRFFEKEIADLGKKIQELEKSIKN